MLQAVSAVQSGGSPSSDVQEALAAASSPVLRIIIDNMFYPVTLDVLQQVPGCCYQEAEEKNGISVYMRLIKGENMQLSCHVCIIHYGYILYLHVASSN